MPMNKVIISSLIMMLYSVNAVLHYIIYRLLFIKEERQYRWRRKALKKWKKGIKLFRKVTMRVLNLSWRLKRRSISLLRRIGYWKGKSYTAKKEKLTAGFGFSVSSEVEVLIGPTLGHHLAPKTPKVCSNNYENVNRLFVVCLKINCYLCFIFCL